LTYLLDTNVCIRFLNGTHPAIAAQMRATAPTDIALCSVVKAELLFGARRSSHVQANLQLLARFFQPFACLAFDDRCAEEAGQIRATLADQGNPIGPNDVLIAATARAHDATLVTHNQNEFSRVTGLRLEDWETPD